MYISMLHTKVCWFTKTAAKLSAAAWQLLMYCGQVFGLQLNSAQILWMFGSSRNSVQYQSSNDHDLGPLGWCSCYTLLSLRHDTLWQLCLGSVACMDGSLLDRYDSPRGKQKACVTPYSLLMCSNIATATLLADSHRPALLEFWRASLMLSAQTQTSVLRHKQGTAKLISHAEWATVLFVIQLSLGEAIWSPRWYDYSMSVAPEGREGVFTAMASAPLFLGKFVTGIYKPLSCVI